MAAALLCFSSGLLVVRTLSRQVPPLEGHSPGLLDSALRLILVLFVIELPLAVIAWEIVRLARPRGERPGGPTVKPSADSRSERSR